MSVTSWEQFGKNLILLLSFDDLGGIASQAQRSGLYLRGVGSNYSHARSVVLHTLLRAEKPVSVMELVYSANEKDPLTVALGTVYNTLRLMEACGLYPPAGEHDENSI
jgi:hypothetical protein